MIRSTFILVLFLGLGSTAIYSQTLNKKLVHNGLEREYFIHLPKNYNSQKKLPLLLAFHGAGDSAYMFMFHSGFNAMADADNIIVVYPQGIKRNNGTRWSLRRADKANQVDDIAFVESLLDLLSKNYKIDSNRVYAAGMSNGGYLSFSLACELGNKISAVASVTGSMTPKMVESCKEKKAMPILQMHGTEDKAVPYLGVPQWSLSIDRVISHWVEVNELGSTPKKKKIADKDKTDGSRVERYVYKSKSSKAKVIHYKIVNGGHDWFGNRGNKDINASEIIWDFIKKN